MNTRFGRWADAGRILLLAAAYYGAGKAGLRLAQIHASVTAVWPPTGLALVAVLLWGARMWPGVLAGAFLVNLTTKGSVPVCLGIAAGNTLEALIGAALVRRFAGGLRALDTTRGVFRFAVLAGLGATAVSASVGVGSLVLGRELGGAPAGSLWLTWWLGDAAGALILAPVLLLWVERPAIRWTGRQTLEAVLLLAGLVATEQIIFSDWMPSEFRRNPMTFLCLPVLVWAAVRFEPRETATAMLALSALAIWNTYQGRGPFASATPFGTFLPLQMFMAVLSVTTLMLAADVLRRRRAEAELREGEERIRRIIDTALDAVVTMDPEGRITEWNPQAERIFGWTRAQAVGTLQVESLVAPQHRGRYREGLKKFMETGQASLVKTRLELSALHQDGHEIPVEMAIVPVWAGGTLFFSGFVRDISERRRIEAQVQEHVKEIERLNASLADQKAEVSTYHSMVTHDITNFCATLQAIVERLLLNADGPLTPKQEQLLRRANRQTFEMNKLSENAKLLTRLRDRGLPAVKDRVSVYGVLQRVLDTVRAVHFDRSFRVDIECPEGISVAGVPFVENIFLNLIDNAVRHAEKGTEPMIRIRIGPENGSVTVKVRGGAAIDGQLLSRMFDRYAKGPHSTGTGLGLALIREIVERSGGKVQASNTREDGEEAFEIAVSLPRA